MSTTAVALPDSARASPSHGRSGSLESRVIASALSGLAPNSRLSYERRIRQFTAWLKESQPGPGPPLPFDRESVKAYLRSLELSGASAQKRNITLSAIKRLAYEAGELGWIDLSDANRIKSIRQVRATGTKQGRWLSREDAERLLSLPDRATVAGRRDAALLSLLIGCGLRRSEAVGIESSQIVRAANGTTVIANIAGKGGRTRTVAVPEWARAEIEAWRNTVEMIDGQQERTAQ